MATAQKQAFNINSRILDASKEHLQTHHSKFFYSFLSDKIFIAGTKVLYNMTERTS